jgi:hypothetical protein
LSKLAFLDPSHDEGSAPVTEAPAEAAPAADTGQPREENGQFAPKPRAPPAEAPLTPPEAPVPAPAVAEAPLSESPPSIAAVSPAVPPGFVPLPALLDTRDELKEAKRELAQFRAQAQPQPEPEEAPDPYTDLQGFLNWQGRQVESQLWSQRLEMSRGFAETKHGPEKVQAAIDWGFERCGSDPHFNIQVRQARDPVGFVISEHQRQQLLAEMSDPSEIEAYRAWKQAQAAGEPPAVPPATTLATPPAAAAAPRQPPAPPPRSIASASSAGGPAAVPTGPGVAFDGVFSRKA